MSHASMAGYFLFFYNRYRKEEILKKKGRITYVITGSKKCEEDIYDSFWK